MHVGQNSLTTSCLTTTFHDFTISLSFLSNVSVHAEQLDGILLNCVIFSAILSEASEEVARESALRCLRFIAFLR